MFDIGFTYLEWYNLNVYDRNKQLKCFWNCKIIMSKCQE